MITPATLQSYLHEKIPLTKAMEVGVEECDENTVILTAPLAPNRNHLQTAFGGSLHALATLSGYSMLWRLLDDPAAHIVIVSSRIAFQRPVRGHLRATCRAPSDAELTRFREEMARRGKARLTLEATIESGEEIAVRFRARFAALRS